MANNTVLRGGYLLSCQTPRGGPGCCILHTICSGYVRHLPKVCWEYHSGDLYRICGLSNTTFLLSVLTTSDCTYLKWTIQNGPKSPKSFTKAGLSNFHILNNTHLIILNNTKAYTVNINSEPL